MEISPGGGGTEAVGLHTIIEYVMRRQATIVEKVTCLPIYELCVKAERRPGTNQSMECWD